MLDDIRDALIIPSSRRLLSTDIEECVIYDRTDGLQVQMSLAFIDFQDPVLCLGVWTPEDLRKGDPSEGVAFSVPEARLLRDLLNRPEVAAILDETKEHRMKRLPGFTLAEIEQLDEEAQS